MKIKQQTINIVMIILLFFLLIQQAFRLLSLNIGLYTPPLMDMKFFIFLAVTAFFLYSLLYLLAIICVIQWDITISINLPLYPLYPRLEEKVIDVYNRRTSYQNLSVIRC